VFAVKVIAPVTEVAEPFESVSVFEVVATGIVRLAIVTVPVSLLVSTTPALMTTAPSVMLTPESDWVAVKVVVPVPALNNPPTFTVIPAPKLVAGLVVVVRVTEPPLFTVMRPLNVFKITLLAFATDPDTVLAPANVRATAPSVRVPLGTESMPQVPAVARLVIPVETRVVAEVIESVPKPDIAPTRFTIAAPVVVRRALATVEPNVTPARNVSVPVLALTVEEAATPPLIVSSPPTLSVLVDIERVVAPVVVVLPEMVIAPLVVSEPLHELTQVMSEFPVLVGAPIVSVAELRVADPASVML
jgi:hypothetical protein